MKIVSRENSSEDRDGRWKNTEEILFSIVIANYNHGQYLEEAILSILKQKCKDYEIIVIDGGSTDNSINIIKKYEKEIDYWETNIDRGQSHAFNKGFKKARGKYYTWLNADDILLPKTLAKAKKYLKRNKNSRWLTGNFIRFDDEYKIREAKWGPWLMPKIFQNRKSPLIIFGPTSFFSSELYRQVGGFDENLHFCMDNDLWVRFMKEGTKVSRLNHYCWGFRLHKESKTSEYGKHKVTKDAMERIKRERKIIKEKTGYRMSKLMYCLHILWRIATLSQIKSEISRFTLIGKDIREI